MLLWNIFIVLRLVSINIFGCFLHLDIAKLQWAQISSVSSVG